MPKLPSTSKAAKMKKARQTMRKAFGDSIFGKGGKMLVDIHRKIQADKKKKSKTFQERIKREDYKRKS